MIHDAHDLLRVRGTERAAEHGEVLREDGDLPTVDLAPAGDDAVAEDLLLLHLEVGAAMLHEPIDLDERARIAKQLDALARGELAALVLLVDALLPATEHSALVHGVELRQCGARGLRR